LGPPGRGFYINPRRAAREGPEGHPGSRGVPETGLGSQGLGSRDLGFPAPAQGRGLGGPGPGSGTPGSGEPRRPAAQGWFYINPSRRGPAPGAGRRSPKGVGEGSPSLLPWEAVAPRRSPAPAVLLIENANYYGAANIPIKRGH